MSRVMPITVALAAMLAAPNAVAQVTSSPDAPPSPWPTVGRDSGFGGTGADTAYIRQTIRGNFSEVGLGRLAESRAADSVVKEFAERMISEHNSMNEQWADLARDNDMKVTLEFSSAGRQSGERLRGLSGAAFDQAYMTEMIRLHEQDLAAFRGMAASARSPEVRKLANSAMSSILEHLILARQVGSRVGVSTTAARTGDGTTPAPRPPAPTPSTPTPSDHDRSRTTADRATRDERDDRNDRGTLRAEDRRFVQEVLQDHLMHIRLAERAQREARSDETRRLAERIEEDFKEWQERWEDVADRYDVKAPSNLGRLHGQKVEKLERASKQNFDRTYAAIVAEHLASVVPYFQKEGRAVRSAAVRRLVEEELPVIRKYQERARQLQGQASARAEASDRE
jgi:putative membrane protein